MPIKRYRKKTPARRRYKAKPKARRTPKAKIGRSMGSPIADRFLCVLPYSEIFAVSFTAAGAPALHQFQFNSIFKPNYTASGHQPLARDEYSTFYNRYLVYGMSYQIHFTSTSATDTGEVMVFLRPDTTVTAIAETIFESPRCQHRPLPPYVNGGAFIKGYASVSKVSGVTKTQMSTNPNYSALITASPAQVPILNIALINENTGANLTARIRIIAKFYTLLYDRKPMAGS